MNKKYIIKILPLVLLLTIVLLPKVFVKKTVAANKDIYDVIIFMGQSDMTGYAGDVSADYYYDSRVGTTNNAKFTYSYNKGINLDIIKNYSSIRHVNVPITANTVFDYKYASNKLAEITSTTTTIGEMLAWNKNTNKLYSVSRQSYFALEQSYGTNMVPQFGKTYYDLTGHKVVAIMASNGGEQIAHFLPHDEAVKYSSCANNVYSETSCSYATSQYIYEGAIEKYKAAIKYLNDNNLTVGNKFYIFWQGFTDVYKICENSVTVDQYAKELQMLHNHLTKDEKLDFGVVIYEVEWHQCNKSDGVIHKAQQQVINNNSNVIEGSTYGYDHYTSNNLSWLLSKDDVHFTSAVYSQVGYETAIKTSEYVNKNKTAVVTFHKNITSDISTVNKVFTTGKSETQKFGNYFTREGYVLSGWSYKYNDATNAYNTTSSVEDKWITNNSPATNLYAVWSEQKLTIRYNKNDWSENTSTETFAYSGLSSKLNPASKFNSRNGYSFAGWSLKPSGLNEIAFTFNGTIDKDWFLKQIGINATKTIDLYAQWKRNNAQYTKYAYMKGDITGDAAIHINDVSRLYRGVKGVVALTTEEKEAGDVVDDRVLSINDVSRLYRYYKGVIKEL